MTKLSIVCPSFNHGRFVSLFIRSVLSQTMNEWELIIVDDNSTDNNVDEILSFNDPRIKLIRHSWNMGINAGLNDGVAAASGEYVVICASDDMLYPRHLETVSGILDERKDIGAVACLLTAIDERGNRSDYLRDFSPYTRDNHVGLRHMFLEGNLLLSPGMTVRRSLMTEICPLPFTDVMVQDYAMWVKILARTKVEWTDVPVVYYRRMSDGANVSARNEAYKLRCEWEESQLMDAYLDLPCDTVSAVFAEDLSRLKLDVRIDTVPYVLGRIALLSPKIPRRAWGYRTIVNFAKDRESYELLHKVYGFDYKQLLSLVEIDITSNQARNAPKGLANIFYKLYRHFNKKSALK